jgi:hypothetical protein
MQAPATTVSLQVEPWAYLIASRQSDSSSASEFLLDPENRRPAEHPSFIFRPPR